MLEIAIERTDNPERIPPPPPNTSRNPILERAQKNTHWNRKAYGGSVS